MFLVSMTQDARLHNIIFWLMGDMSMTDLKQVGILSAILIPGFILIFCLSHAMNLLLMGREMAMSMGLQLKTITVTLLVATSFMVSATVSHCGLIGFVGLVIPHLLRMVLGPDHRVLVPACILGGGAYMVFCDLLARTLPQQGEMPAGVITALIGAPLFIILLQKVKPMTAAVDIVTSIADLRQKGRAERCVVCGEPRRIFYHHRAQWFRENLADQVDRRHRATSERTDRYPGPAPCRTTAERLWPGKWRWFLRQLRRTFPLPWRKPFSWGAPLTWGCWAWNPNPM